MTAGRAAWTPPPPLRPHCRPPHRPARFHRPRAGSGRTTCPPCPTARRAFSCARPEVALSRHRANRLLSGPVSGPAPFGACPKRAVAVVRCGRKGLGWPGGKRHLGKSGAHRWAAAQGWARRNGADQVGSGRRPSKAREAGLFAMAERATPRRPERKQRSGQPQKGRAAGRHDVCIPVNVSPRVGAPGYSLPCPPPASSLLSGRVSSLRSGRGASS
jgi:hypothetical protein